MENLVWLTPVNLVRCHCHRIWCRLCLCCHFFLSLFHHKIVSHTSCYQFLQLFTATLRAFKSSVCHAVNLLEMHSLCSWLVWSFKFIGNCYHNLILKSKKQYHSNFFSSSNNPRRLWQTVYIVNPLYFYLPPFQLVLWQTALPLFLQIKLLNFVSLWQTVLSQHLHIRLLLQNAF